MDKNIINKWNNKKFLIESFSFGNPISMALLKEKKDLNEGLIRTHPIETVKRYLIKLYQFDDSQLQIFKDNKIEKLRIIIPNNNMFIEKIEKVMTLCGYFCSVKHDYPEVENWIYLNFEPKNQDDVNEYVRNMKYIFHVTPEKYINKIKKIGLKPTFKNKFFSYPDRVYFFINDTSPEEIYSLKNQLKQNNDKYCLLVIEVSKIPDNVNSYLDPNFEYGIYTNDNIPNGSIVEMYEMID